MNLFIPKLNIDNQYPFYQLYFRFEHRFCVFKFKFEHLISSKSSELMHLEIT